MVMGGVNITVNSMTLLQLKQAKQRNTMNGDHAVDLLAKMVLAVISVRLSLGWIKSV
jgi:hypothetical protein